MRWMTFGRPSLIGWFRWNRRGNVLSDENRRIAFIGMHCRMAGPKVGQKARYVLNRPKGPSVPSWSRSLLFSASCVNIRSSDIGNRRHRQRHSQRHRQRHRPLQQCIPIDPSRFLIDRGVVVWIFVLHTHLNTIHDMLYFHRSPHGMDIETSI